jgi:hypothetical protein
VPVTGLAANFSPTPRIAPPPFGKVTVGGATGNAAPVCTADARSAAGASCRPAFGSMTLHVTDPPAHILTLTLGAVLTSKSRHAQASAMPLVYRHRNGYESGRTNRPSIRACEVGDAVGKFVFHTDSFGLCCLADRRGHRA